MNLVKKLFILIQALLSYSFFAAPAFAQTNNIVLDPCTGATGILGTLCTLTVNIPQTMRNIIILLIVIAIIIALVYLIIGGIRWITSRGDKEQVESARNNIVAAIVGLIIVFVAIFIISLILLAFGISFSDLNIPSIISR